MTAELYRAWPDLLRLGARSPAKAEIVYVSATRTAHVVEARPLRALVACQGFATLDQHAAAIAAQGGGSRAAVREDLAGLVQAGLLAPAGALVTRLGRTDPEPAPPPVATLGIPTKERVPELCAALESYIANARAHGRTLAYVVGDDAPTAAGRAETRAALTAVQARHGVPLAYAGLEEKTRYAAALARHAGVPRDLLDFALVDPEGCAYKVGANQNTLLLHGAGAPMVQVDDDTRCRVAPTPGQLPGLALTSRGDPTEMWFPGPGAPDLPERVLVDRDLVSIHESLLGRRVTDCVADARRLGLDVDGVSGWLLRRLEPRGGRVACTQIGGAGDSGTGSMWHYLFLGDPSRSRLHASEAAYRHAFTRRRVVRAVRRATVSDGGFFMSMNIGLDTRSLLPPFFPAQRNSDGVFGSVLRAAWHDAFFGFAPWVMEHAPAARRASPFPAFFEGLGRTDADDLVCILINGSRVDADRDDPARGLRALGEVLERWGSLPLADFEELVRVQVLRARSLDLVMLDEAVQRHQGAPAYWARDVERTVAGVRAALPAAWLPYPTDLVTAYGEAAARPLFARLVRRYGELLQVWPDLFEAAIDLGRRGVRPGTPLPDVG
jgi:hypothetical protein